MNKTWFKILISALITGLFLAGLYYYSRYFLAADKGFSEMSARLQESGTLVFAMAGLLDTKLPQSLSGLVEKENAKDLKGAAEIVTGSLEVVEELSQKNEMLKLKTEEFKSAADALGSKTAEDSARKTADILDRLVLHFEKIAGLERGLLSTAKNYYEALILDPKTEAPSFIQINAKIATASTEFSSLLKDFAIAANDLNTIINGKPAVSKAEPGRLQIEDVALGQSEGAKNGDTLVVHYVGTLENGAKFDSSVDRGRPFSFTLGAGQVIKGWEQGLLGMKIGGHRKLIIPPDLGYGSRATGSIPPNSILIFEIDLLDIK